MEHTNSYRKGHPNPQFVREDFVNLDGMWSFAFDDEDQGYEKDYPHHFPKGMEIRVPFAYESPSSGIGDKGIHKIVWYQKKFDRPKKEGRVFLHFLGVDYLSEVYLNGHYIGKHEGAYTRFDFEITRYLEEHNVLTVRCYDDFSCTHARGKQRWKKESYECFYVETTGIYQSVYLEVCGESYLRDARLTPSYENTSCKAEFRIGGFQEGLELEAEISFQGKTICRQIREVNREIFTEEFDLTDDEATMKLHTWSHENPSIYDVIFTLRKNGKTLDKVLSYFGVAEYRTEGRSIYRNREFLFPRLILDQGYSKKGHLTLTEEEMVSDILNMKEIGFNGCRKHQKIESPLFYYYCDILGFYMWEELPSAYEWKDDTEFNLVEEWMGILRQNHSHPSVMAEVIVNESWGTMAIGTSIPQQEFALGLLHLTKSLEPNRLVISNDGWESVNGDLINIHDYDSTYAGLMAKYGVPYDEFLHHRPALWNLKTPFVSLSENQGEKPILMTEFGGVAFAGEKGWGYGENVKDEEEYLARVKGQVDAIFDSRLFSGFCFTQLSDVQQEVNGLLDEERNFKSDKERLKAIFSRGI